MSHEHNPALNAIVTLDVDGARELARRVDAGVINAEEADAHDGPGPLHGVALTLKDCHATAGMRTTAGSPALADYVPEADGAIARRLKRAGSHHPGQDERVGVAGRRAVRQPGLRTRQQPLGPGAHAGRLQRRGRGGRRGWPDAARDRQRHRRLDPHSRRTAAASTASSRPSTPSPTPATSLTCPAGRAPRAS